MNELIREQDPIGQIEDDIVAPDHRPKPKQISAWVWALALSLAIWGLVLGSAYLIATTKFA